MKTLPIKHFFAFCLVISMLFSATTTAYEEEKPMTENNNEQIIREFIDSWSDLDAGKLVSYFSEDGSYYNMPTQPVKGHENLQKFIAGFIANWSKTEWEIINLIARDDIVMVERMDRTIVNGKEVNLPCFGIFEMENGKIVEWRDYFDLATYTNALTE